MCNHLTYLLLCGLLLHTVHSAVYVPAPKSLEQKNASTAHTVIGNLTMVKVNQTGKSTGNSRFSEGMYSVEGRPSAEGGISHAPGNISAALPDDSGRPAVWAEIRQVCGYYRMCTRQQVYSGYSLMPTCCPRCSCHASCVLSNNCCPDMQLTGSQPDHASTCATLYDVFILAQQAEEQWETNADINDTRSETTQDRHQLSTTTAAQATVTAHLLNHVKETITEAVQSRQVSGTEAAGNGTRTGFAADNGKEDTGQEHSQQQTQTTTAAGVNDLKVVNTTNDKHNTLNSNDSAEPKEKQNVTMRSNLDMESNNVRVANNLYAKYVIVASCPPDFKKTAVIKKCIQKYSALTRDLIPVMDIVNEKIYKNAHCAQCHGIINYIPMDIVTTCTKLYLLDAIPMYFKDFQTVTQGCLAYVDPTTYKQTESKVCNPVVNDEAVINQCNVTGLWESYDPYTETMCEKGKHMAPYRDRGTESADLYRNIYCYMCNKRTRQKNTCDAINYSQQKSIGNS